MPEITPKEALSWLEAKSLKIGFDHKDVWREEHSKAFTVAKAMQLDILDDIKTAVETALKDGKTFEQFRKELTPTLQKKGWWGRQELTDPLDGRPKEVQLGSARRLQVIYRTNMRTSRAAGQWERIQRTKQTLPFLRYGLGPSENHRPEHESWSDMVLSADDPFWSTHYPPNGWGCKCRVRQVSAAEANRLGVDIPPNIQYQEYVHRRTGEVTQVPKGIDPGWDYNPGANKNQPVEHFSQKASQAQTEVAKQAIRSWVKSDAFDRWFYKPQGAVPVALLDTNRSDALNKGFKLLLLEGSALDRHSSKQADLTPKDYQVIQQVIDNSDAVQKSSMFQTFLWEAAGQAVIVKLRKSSNEYYIEHIRLLSKSQSKHDKEFQKLRKVANK